ncbi:MAG: hypothetical protein DF168_00010 [Candidatus Moanabacter tarae]|uniref:Uncharacterized protein n=1 Tax=Candidatus Moanibacter tarae TaxID=2200854 RepID=A0A2Z4AD91_9BACT|nr:MAG: hypothetical protein DF168_00010 [Candidatus Moanabacter tarae]
MQKAINREELQDHDCKWSPHKHDRYDVIAMGHRSPVAPYNPSSEDKDRSRLGIFYHNTQTNLFRKTPKDYVET